MNRLSTVTRRQLLSGGAGLAGLILTAPLAKVMAAAGGIDGYADLLARYVVASSDGVNRVDYAAWQATPADRQTLVAFIDGEARKSPSQMPAAERFAYWTNLYNALTLAVVLDAYPVGSIRDIKSKGRLLDLKRLLGPWRTKLIVVEGRQMSLDDIEHGTLRTEFRDPRVHYAVNCASIGCPNLLERPWRAASLADDLDAAARTYVNHPRGVTVRRNGTLKISSLYKWFDEDFGSSDAGILRHLGQYADQPLAAHLAGNPRITADAYDWALNDISRPS